MNEGNQTAKTDIGDILAIGFGTTVAMWAAAYFLLLPPAAVPTWLVLALMFLFLLCGGFVAGRRTPRGLRGGLYVGLTSGMLNLLILGSVMGESGASGLASPAAYWIPGSILVSALLCTIGAALGSRSYRMDKPAANWKFVFTTVATLASLLLIAAGGQVTSLQAGLAVPDWPTSFGYNMFLYPLNQMTGGIFYEHAHRLLGSLVGLTTLVLALYLQFADRRRWLKGLGWLALVLVIFQGIMGGIRVTMESDALALVHAVLAQVFFGLLVSIAVFTTTLWQSATKPKYTASAPLDQSLTKVLLAVLLVQLTLGAQLRHFKDFGVHLHITVAVFVLILVIFAGVRAWGLHEDVRPVYRAGKGLMHLVILQVVLGILALIFRVPDLPPIAAHQAILATAHQVFGAVLLAMAVILMLLNHRLLAAPPSKLSGADT